jgi:hypothetical protein
VVDGDLELREVEGREEDDGRQASVAVVPMAVESRSRRGGSEQDQGEQRPDQCNRPATAIHEHRHPLLGPESGPTLLPR